MGHPAYNRGKGKAYLWLKANCDYTGDECLKWPFSTHPTGYGSFGYLGELYYAHRFMCQLVNGPPPSPTHEASHSCGKGHLSCVNPRHLSWKTPSENKWEQSRHGTNRGSSWGNKGALNPDQVRVIRVSKEHRKILAARYGLSTSAIRRVQYGVSYKSVT